MCCEAGFTTTTEVMVVEGKQKRMDLVITLPTGRVWIDVSFVNPLAPSYLSDKDPKATREKAKVAKWGNDARHRGVTFVPFIVDIYGGIGGQAKEWLGEIAKAAAIRNMVEIDSRDITPATWQGQYRWELVSQIGAAVAHANYCMVEEAALKSEWSAEGAHADALRATMGQGSARQDAERRPQGQASSTGALRRERSGFNGIEG